MSLDYKLIGERLKKARIKKGYTQEQLAEKMKVSIAYLSKIETGKTHINLKRLDEICTILETSEAYILEGVSNNSHTYLNNELNKILKDCSSKDKELIYQIATIISENKQNKKSKENEIVTNVKNEKETNQNHKKTDKQQ